jgi:hypothetical protein
MAARKRKRKPKPAEAYIDPKLVAFKKVPQEILNADKVSEQLLGKKIVLKRKIAYKVRSAITNYQNAIARKRELETFIKRNVTSLKQAHSELKKLVTKLGIKI